MIEFIDVTGKTEDEAIQNALAQLKLDRDDVSVEILERAKTGFLGIGSSPARVRVSYDNGKPEEPVKPAKPAEPKPEKKAEAKPAAPLYAPEVLQKKNSSAGESRSESKDRPRREDRTPRAPRAERAERPERPAPQPKAPVDLGEECHDEKSEQIRDFLKGLLEHMDSAAKIKVYESEKGRYKVFLEGEKLGALIGRRGETLDAIQQLTNYSINRGSEKNRVRVQVDAENYREKREQSLERLAEKVAGKVIKYRRNVTLEPMNAYERHVIHTALQDTPGVTTFSIGSEPNRRVVVSYDRTKA